MNTMMKTRNVLAGLVLASGGLFATGASAAPIAAWDWQSDGGFVVGGSTCSNGGEAACNLQYDNGGDAVTPSGVAGTASIMTWGNGTTSGGGNGFQSGLQAVFGSSGDGPFNAQLLGSGPTWVPGEGTPFGQIITNGGWTTTGAAVHYNNVITIAGGHMQTSMLTTNFQLLTPGPGPVVSADLDILFEETANSSPCTGLNPHGTECDDIFTLTGSLSPIVFTVDGQQYQASFRFANGPGAIVDGNTIYTAEDSPGTAIVFVQGRIDTIPLPGVLALMGMGLVMIGWQVRGRRKLV